MPEWYSNTDVLDLAPGDLRKRLFILAGPSGVGKTTLASMLCGFTDKLVILPNYTTRPLRDTDPADHFRYLTDDEFTASHAQRQFFLCRLAPFPRYGYTLIDLNAALSAGKRPLFMFRHSGVEYVTTVLGGVPTVFLEGDLNRLRIHSHNKVQERSGEEAAAETLSANRRLFHTMTDKHWPCRQMFNTFSGATELLDLAHSILDFLATCDEF